MAQEVDLRRHVGSDGGGSVGDDETADICFIIGIGIASLLPRAVIK